MRSNIDILILLTHSASDSCFRYFACSRRNRDGRKFRRNSRFFQNHSRWGQDIIITVSYFELNPRALDNSTPLLSNAQGFGSISRTIASEYSTVMRYFKNFRIFHQHFISPRKIKQNPKSTTLFFNIPKYFAALMKILKKNQSFSKSFAK